MDRPDKNKIINDITEIRKLYASTNNKHLIFPTQYKINCAKNVTKSFDIETLIDSTLCILPNTYHVFFDYTVFKTFAIPELYEKIVNTMIEKMKQCLELYGFCEVHINLNTFSLSAFHRYSPIIKLYINECINKSYGFVEKIKKTHIYNIPSTIDSISQLIQPMMVPQMRNNLVKYDKDTSIKKLETIKHIIESSKGSICTNEITSENTI